jgi:2-polyprenyl-6-methoxyphenol hydroxylase-like FAD-dependent oxidoreductase
MITAQGIQDGFLDAELCAAALDATYSGQRPYEVAMREYQEARDRRALPMYELTNEFATLEPPPAEMQQLLTAIHGNQSAMDDFARVVAGTLHAPEFFRPDNVQRLLAAVA